MNSQERRRLDVLLSEEHLGQLERLGPTRYRLTYDAAAVARYGEGAIVLSAALPLREEPYSNAQTKPFFEGLLPEGVVRREVARALGVSEANGFGLLEAIGADCAGAVVILPPREGDAPRHGDIRWLSDTEVEERLRELPRHPLGIDPEEGIRLSLGGVQEKLVVTRSPDGRFGQPVGGAPSTHIIKPDQGRYADIVANEAFCLHTATHAGLDAARVEMMTFGEIECLVVERFDRTISEDGSVWRLHQEDMCQALGVLPEAKYEAEGGPSTAQVFRLLREIGTAQDLRAFTNATLLSFLLGNSDAHGKNFALLYNEPGAVRFAPLYDVVSTAVYPGLTRRLAMSIGGGVNPEEVDEEAWLAMLAEGGFRPQRTQLHRDVSSILQAATETRDRARADGWHRPLLDDIVGIAEERARQLVPRPP